MKKAALIIVYAIVLSTLYFLLNTKVHAQALTFERAYRDYQFNLSAYDQAYSDYKDAKNAYLANQTLPLKDEASRKTFTMLVARDQMMVVYLTALRTKISELPGLSSDDKNGIFGKIDAEVNFYTNHKSGYGVNDGLDTLFSKSAQSESQFKDTTSLIVSESLFDISLGQEEGIRITQEQIYDNLKTIINEGVSAGKLTIDPFNHWFTDIDATDTLLKDKEGTSKTQIQTIYSQTYTYAGGYNQAIATLTSSQKSLSQLNEFLTQVVNYIKNQQ
jgi:hypothetical protein